MKIIRIVNDSKVCTFCYDPHPVVGYPCGEFVCVGLTEKKWWRRPERLIYPEGVWFACAVCSEMIATDRWDDLARRGFLELSRRVEIHPGLRTGIVENVKRKHIGFREHRRSGVIQY
jgi:hypothetical protein